MNTNPDRLHVLQVLGNAILGGMEQWVERLIERLPRERYAFSVLCPFESPFTERLRALEVDVFAVPMPEDLPWTTLQGAAALATGAGVDLLHAHMPRAHLLAGLVGRLTGTPVVTTLHGRQLTTLDLEVQRATGSHVSVVCRQSYFHALGLGVDPEHLSCDCNGVDVERFRPLPRSAEGGLRAALGLGPEAPLLGFVGRLSPEKGPEVAVRAALMLRHRRPDAHTVFVGEGPMRAELQALARQLGVQGQVHFAGTRLDMAQVYGDFDALVSTSHTEAMPLAVMEAMACGVPVVATRVGGVPELVEHGHTGWLAGPGDFDDVAQRCAVLLDEPALRERMGLRARERVMRHFELGRSVERVDRLLTRLARPRRAPAKVTLASRSPGNGPGAAIAGVGLPQP